MSVLANNFKMKFAGLLRGMLRRVDGSEDVRPQTEYPAVATAPQPIAATPATPVVPPAPPQPAMAPITQMTPAPMPERAENLLELEMPLLPILEKLPPDLRTKWVIGGTNLGQANICISVEKILPQLSQGAVKITFGELRLAAPDLFRTGEEYDSLPIVLPLNDVLARLNPAVLTRNPAQKTVTAPTEIAGPFGSTGQGAAFASTLLKPTPSTTHFLRKAPVQSEPIKMPMPMPVAPPPPSFAQRSAAPLPATALPMPPRMNKPAPSSQMPVSTRTPAPFPKPAAPIAPAAMPAASPEAPTLQSPLAALAESWPETLRLEIVQLNLSAAQVALPVHLIQPALKRGRVIFPWHQIRSWIRPSPPGISIHDSLELELPLKVLAPLFLPRQKPEAKPQTRTSLPPSTVPNLFFGFPQPQPETLEAAQEIPEAVPIVKPLAPKPTETNYYVWSDNGETPSTDRLDYKRPATPATDFSSRRAMPKEIVERAMKLPGVVGAVIALPDGLKVAHQLPPELNPDTVSAFLPQLFSRVSQCSKELRMGELNNLNFTIGNIPWKIFRVNAVYFAAFGRTGEPLPTAQLAVLAGELDRKK